MMNDTIRVQTKISARLTPRINTSTALAPPPPSIKPPVTAKKRVTGNLFSCKTSQTLVEFQNKKTSLPDWRIQLQNAVQHRKGGSAETPVFTESSPAALKVAADAPPAEIEIDQAIADPRVANAMRRIAESRKTFHETAPKQKRPVPLRPFGVVSAGKAFSNSTATAAAPARISLAPKPVLVKSPVAEKRDTNKLPPIAPAPEKQTATPVLENVEKILSGSLPTKTAAIHRIEIKTETADIPVSEAPEFQTDEIEDLAPMSMRFGAGLFDFIIGGFAAMILLSPLAFTNANWFTTSSILTFAGTFALVMFAYMTACLGFFGKTMGMRLFQLELVDAVDNEYPTLRQAAINSSIFILTVPFAGAGFLAIFFNEERRGLHDLLSGTILVREF